MSDLGVFIDWCALYQQPRSAVQQATFATALSSINLWYAHQGTTVWLVTGGADDAGVSYWAKGWCSCEYALTMMVKVANTSAWADWPQVVDISQRGRDAQTGVPRPPPAEPLAFFGGHEYGEKVYRRADDRDGVVAPMFRDTVLELLGSVKELNYNKLGWGDAHAVLLARSIACANEPHLPRYLCAPPLPLLTGDAQAIRLARVLPLCAQLQTLQLTGNATIGDAGVRAIAEALAGGGSTAGLAEGCSRDRGLPVGGRLRDLRLGGNSIGDDGVAALVRCASREGGLAFGALEALHLNINRVGDQGVRALCELGRTDAHRAQPQPQPDLGQPDAWVPFRALRVLNLQHNPAMGDDGALALAACLADGGLPALSELHVPEAICEHARLAEACRRRSATLK